MKYSKLTSSELDEIEQTVIECIDFIDEEQIPAKYFLYAESLLHNVDLKDLPFVALTEYLNGVLWTGDKKLIEGLSIKGFTQTITTAQLSALFDEV